jgi:hypothetical protein
MERQYFPFDKNMIPQNGIYILFEKGEFAHSGDRIVRIGTHTGENKLYSRLNQHFVLEKKDRSIFRKNIGRALLNKGNDIFLEQWELDLTTKEAKNKHKVDIAKQENIEKEVSKYIREYFSFVVFELENKDIRLSMESKIISTVSLCLNCKQSKEWLGNYSTKEKIKNSGLWLVNELWKTPLNDEDIKFISKLMKNNSKQKTSKNYSNICIIHNCIMDTKKLPIIYGMPDYGPPLG